MDSLSSASHGHARTTGQLRRGVSLIEALGCVLAIGVGIWAGAAYLGIDLQAACALGLERLGVPVSLPVGDSSSAASASREPDQSQPGGTSSDGKGVRQGDDTGTNSAKDDGERNPGEATLAYWNVLREILLEEWHTRRSSEAADARRGLQVRADAYAFAADALRQSSVEAVDPELVQLGRELSAWYIRGAELSDEGTLLLDQGDLSSADSPLGQRWHTAEKQHQAELDLLQRKFRSMESKLRVRYNLPFNRIW